MAAAQRHAVRMLRRAHGLPQARVRRAKRGTEEYAVATVADAGGDTLSASSIAPCFHALARAGVPSEAGVGVGRRYEVVDSKTLFLAEPDYNIRDYVAPMPYAINLVEVSWQSAPPLKSEFAAALIGGFDMRQCAVAHELTDGFQLREVVSAAARDAVWHRQMVPTVHAFELASPTLSEEQMMAVRLCRLVNRVDKYHRRGFTLPTTWRRPEVCEQVHLTLSTCTWHSAYALKQALVVLAKWLSPLCGPMRQLASGVWIQDGASLFDSSLVELEGVDAAGTVCMDVDCTSIGGDGAAVWGAAEDAPAIVLVLCEHGSAHGGTVSANNALGMAFNSGGRTQGHMCSMLPRLRGGGAALQQQCGIQEDFLHLRRARKRVNTRNYRMNKAVHRQEQQRNTESKARRRQFDAAWRSSENEALKIRMAKKREDKAYREQEKMFAAERARRRRSTVHLNLYELHAASGARITANSRRLRTLRRAYEKAVKPADKADLWTAYEQARADTAQDIQEFAHIEREDQATAVRKFHKCTECAVANLAIVCGACGLRSIEETFHGPVKLRDVDDDHWLCVNRDALARLDAEPPIKLLNRDGKEVCVRRREIHNLLEVDGRAFHVVPEAVDENGCIYLCGKCHTKWKAPRDLLPLSARPVAASDAADMHTAPAEAAGTPANGVPPALNMAESSASKSDRFDDLYWSHAPPNAIAGGHDYGRLSALAGAGVAVDVSSLEKLVLADARCHLVCIKVVSLMYGKARTRRRLHGHRYDDGRGEGGHSLRLTFCPPPPLQYRLSARARRAALCDAAFSDRCRCARQARTGRC